MQFVFDVKFKNGQIERITIQASMASDAVKQLMSMYNGISSYKLIS